MSEPVHAEHEGDWQPVKPSDAGTNGKTHAPVVREQKEKPYADVDSCVYQSEMTLTTQNSLLNSK